jgi:competence ComEA-like helix-hairpin-helix protein
MTHREKYAAIGILAVFALGLLFLALNRYQFYHKYIDVSGLKGPEPYMVPEHVESELKVDINNANLEELMRVPGIGRVTGLSIIEYRTLHGEFSHIDELMNVKGIGEKKLEMLKRYVTIR